MFGRSGLLGILVIGGMFYFTGAGAWIGKQLNGINDRCYSTLSGISTEIANPICQTVSSAFTAAARIWEMAGDRVVNAKLEILGISNIEVLDNLTNSLASSLGSLASSRDDLNRIVSLGPNHPTIFANGQFFQNAIDSFAIGREFLLRPGMNLEAVPWLQRGAAQPYGYGVMSQLALGNMYAKGAEGVAANPKVAAFYFQQAHQSLTELSGSNSLESQKVLKALPISPQQMQRDIERVIRDMGKAK